VKIAVLWDETPDVWPK